MKLLVKTRGYSKNGTTRAYIISIAFLVSTALLYPGKEMVKNPAIFFQKTAGPIISNKTALLSHSDAPDDEDDNDDRFMNPSPVCQKLASASAMSLWVKNIDHILAAGKQPGDPTFKLQDMTAQVLKLITPRLPLSPRSFTRDWEKVEYLLNKVYARYQYIQDDTKKGKEGHDETPPSPLKIVIMGGSVTMGINCYTSVKRVRISQCAWAARLPVLINTLAGGKLVEVINISVGGVNTGTARSFLEYDLLPVQAQNPDVIINAYSTNDMHVITMGEAKKANVTLRDKVFDMAQEFARFVLDQPCIEKRPLLLWMDDYLGNEQRQILSTTELSQAIQVLANYYGFGFMSYADTVRDLVYGDTRETSFSPAGWYRADGRYAREIHPGAVMHTATSFVVAFYIMHTVTTFCSLESWKATEYEKRMQYNLTTVPGLPALSGESVSILLKPKPTGIPPLLTKDLLIEQVSDQWQKQAAARIAVPADCSAIFVDDDGTTRRRCPFSWLSGLGIDPARDNIEEAVKYFEPYLVKPSGWDLLDDSPPNKRIKAKYGWMPAATNTSTISRDFVLEFPFEGEPIKSLTLFVLKSYGDKWENSTAEVTVQSLSDSKEIITHTMVGYHDKETSEMYTEEVKLPIPTTRLRVIVRLIKGGTFKIQGIALCS
jgi:hypothetical protein